jgi:pyridoxamine 5'-phosphate oxidase
MSDAPQPFSPAAPGPGPGDPGSPPPPVEARVPTPLEATALGTDPLTAFGRWLEEAEDGSGLRNFNAVTLSTVDAQGRPDGRVVLLKGVDDRGFVFFTNYDSAKGRAMEAVPRAALTFHWDLMGRQVRARGRVERVPERESDAYFRSRPREARLGAWASDQSRELEDRSVLEARYRELEASWSGREIPRPSHWGGYVLIPEEVEFWQEGAHRLHDRILFRRSDGGWDRVRLFP